MVYLENLVEHTASKFHGPHLMLLDNSISRVSKSSKICSPNENVFVYTYSYICQYDMAVLFAAKLNLYNIFWPLFTEVVLFLRNLFETALLLSILASLNASRIV